MNHDFREEKKKERKKGRKIDPKRHFKKLTISWIINIFEVVWERYWKSSSLLQKQLTAALNVASNVLIPD